MLFPTSLKKRVTNNFYNRYKMLRRLLASLLLLQLVAGCAGTTQTTPAPQENTATDRSCAYFYFLWGTHAEYDQRFEEALEAYQKALICDPAAETVQKKFRYSSSDWEK